MEPTFLQSWNFRLGVSSLRRHWTAPEREGREASPRLQLWRGPSSRSRDSPRDRGPDNSSWGKPAAVSWGHSSSPKERSMWQGTEASYLQPCDWVISEVKRFNFIYFWLWWVFNAAKGFPTWGVQQREEEFLENQTLKATGIWLQDLDRTGGKRDSTLGGHTQSSVRIGIQGKEQWPQGRLNQTYLLVLGGLLQRQGVAVAHHGDKDTGSRSSGKYSLAWALPDSSISLTKEPR